MSASSHESILTAPEEIFLLMVSTEAWAIQDSAPERSEEVTLGCRGQCPRVPACGRHHRP
ncbi:MAG: hypothetical protein P8M32_03430 [Phycisphaerales bacterium]|nr:hypothetical protein [Phycisphaerales bacterium]